LVTSIRFTELLYSVLIFSFPFLFPVLFGGISTFSNKVNIGIVIFILGVNSSTLIFQRKHYTLFYESIYKEIVLNATNQNCKRTVLLLDASGTNKDIIEHYLAKWKVNLPFRWMDSFQTLGEFRKYVKAISMNHESLYFGAIFDARPTLIPIIQEFFPKLEKRRDYISGSTFVFSKGKPTLSLRSIMHLDKNVAHWKPLSAYKPYIQTGHFKMDSTIEYSIGYENILLDLLPKQYDIIDVSLRVKFSTKMCHASIVTSISASDQPLDWSSTNFSEYVDSTNSSQEWLTIHHSICPNELARSTKNAKLSIFVWNADKETFSFDDIRISIRKENPIKFGLYFPVMESLKAMQTVIRFRIDQFII
jgi:hypothetical protein